MCITAFDSLLVYVVNILSNILLFNYGKTKDCKITALFLSFVGQMQIIDFLFWKNLDCSPLNTKITQLGIIFNHLQPVVLIVLQNAFGLRISKVSLFVVVLYSVFALFYSAENFINVKCTTLSPENKVVFWQWNKEKYNSIMYSLFLLSFLTSSANFESKKFGYMMMVIGISTLIMGNLKPKLNESPGRMWCYYTAITPILILVISRKFNF